MSIEVKDNKISLWCIRIEPGEDLLNSLKSIFIKANITNGIIVSCIGSLRHATLIFLQKNFKYSQPTRINGPLEFLSAQGTIGIDNDKISIHLHGIISDHDMCVYGGHFVDDEDGNLVFATMEICVLVPEDISFIKQYDDKTGFKIFNPNKR
ncbi:MAG: DNA-binding protein [Thermoanaerobacteraceae bacterium]|nr:DNA-binding protein [Thermoanaerobacteraceae bacterium]